MHAEGAWAMTEGFGFNMSYTVNFETATADYDLVRGVDALRICEKGKSAQFVKCDGPDGYVRELQHILECIQQSKAPTVVTAADALKAIEICEAEEKSVLTRQMVALS